MAERRVTAAILAAALALAAGGCGEPADPAPRPRSVTPDRGAASAPVAVVIHGSDFDAAASTDFEGRDESTIDARFQVLLGAVALREVRLRQDGTLTATVPEGIAVGTHDLTVIDPDGQRGTLAAAYRALSDVDVAQLVASYRVDVGAAQEAYAPFDVTVTALDGAGATVTAFNGEVALADLTGTAVPGTLARFQGGAWSGRVEVRAPHAADVLRVADALGNTGASAPFRVAPAPAASLRFATPPRATVAGACSGAAQPLTLELLDAFGQPTTADAEVPLLPTLPAGLSLYADDACAAPLAAPVIAAGSGAVTAWFRSTLAGAAALDVAATGIAGASQVEAVVAAAPSRVAFVTAPRSSAAGACSPVATVEVRDAWDNPATGGAVAVDLAASPSAGFALFADAACTVPAASVASDAATARADLWFRGTAAQPVTITASGAGLAAASQVETVVAAAAHHLAFTTAPRTVTAGVCSAGVTLEARDAWENPATVVADAPVALADDATGTFELFAGAGCATPAAGAVTLAAGTSAITASFRAAAAETVTLGASAAGLIGASQTEQVVAAAPSRLEFASPPQTLMAGTCASADLLLRDAFGNAATAASATAVALASTPASGFAFYADASCEAGPPVVATTLAAGAGGASFWFRAVETGTFDVDATAAGLLGASQAETITPAIADRLVFATSPQTVAAGACSGAVTVRSMDPLGNVSALASGATVGLAASAASGFTFHADAACGSPAVTSASIPAAGSEATFWFRATVAEGASVSVSATGLTGASQAETIVPAAADRLVFATSPQTVAAGACSGAVTVRSMDPLGNVSSLAAGATVALASSAGAGFTFHADAACAGAPVGSASIPAAGSEATFWFRATVAEGVTVSVSAAGLTGASQAQTITPGAADRLVFVTSAQTVTAGVCSGAVTVRSMDPHGNVSPLPSGATAALASSAAAGFTFHADAACAGAPVGSASIPAAASEATFWFRATVAEGVTVSVSAAGLTGASQAETIVPATADRLVFTTAPQTVTAGDCSGVLTVETRDPFGNAVPASSEIPLTVSALPAAGITFHADGACSIPLAAGEPALLAGSSTASFHLVGTDDGAVTVTVAAGTLTPAAQAETIVAAEPDALFFTSAPQGVPAGTCSASTDLEIRDVHGNVAVAPAPIDVALSSSAPATFAFYGDPACVTPISSTTIATGTSAAAFWFEGTAAGSVTVDVAASGLSGASQDEAIGPAAPARLVYATPERTVVAGACSGDVTLQALDGFDNPSPVLAVTPVALAAGGAGGVSFFAGSGCGGLAVASVDLPAGASSVTFSFTATAAGPFTLTATGSGLSPDPSQLETVTVAPPDRLEFTTLPQTVTAGGCSSLATVRSMDPYGNASPVGADATVDLLAIPATGFGFFSDATCNTPVASTTIAAGTGSASFHFRGTVSGTVSVTASVAGWAAVAAQDETIAPGAATHLAWDPIPTPVAADQPIAVRIAALDAHENVAVSFAGTADLSLSWSGTPSPAPTLTCIAGCAGLTTTGFTSGTWAGTVSVSEPGSATPGTPDRWIVATSGPLTASSNAFEVVAVPARTPPAARLGASPRVAWVGSPVQFDASASSDYQTPAADLLVSWVFEGTPTGVPAYPTPASPWTAWSTTKTAEHAFASAGVYTVRLAVRDGDGDLGFASTTVYVLSAATAGCVVDTDQDVDDAGAVLTCADAASAGDGKLSFREALRLVPAGGRITFGAPMTLAGATAFDVTKQVEILAYGVVLDGQPLVISGGTGLAPVVIRGLEVTGQATRVSSTGGGATFVDLFLHDGQGIEAYGALVVRGGHLEGCTGACITSLDDSGNDRIEVYHSTFVGSGSGTGVDVAECKIDAKNALTAHSNVFIGLDAAIRVTCAGETHLFHNTFDSNRVGVAYLNPDSRPDHDLQNNIFSFHSVAAITTVAGVDFDQRNHQLLWQNASNGGLGGDWDTLVADPLYVLRSEGDYRLAWGSPAIDSAINLSLNLLPAFPAPSTQHDLGTGPDRGGIESY